MAGRSERAYAGSPTCPTHERARWSDSGRTPEPVPAAQRMPMSFVLYLIGVALVVGGIAWGLVTAGVSTTAIAITCLIVAGVGIMMAVSRTRAKD